MPPFQVVLQGVQQLDFYWAFNRAPTFNWAPGFHRAPQPTQANCFFVAQNRSGSEMCPPGRSSAVADNAIAAISTVTVNQNHACHVF